MSQMPVKQSTLRPLYYEHIGKKGFAPIRASEYAAGYDLFAAHDAVVSKQGRLMVMTDIKVAIPDGCYGRIAPRSGLALKNFIDIGGGVIDPDYRGNVGVIMFNHSDSDLHVHRGDRIAQLIVERIADTELIQAKLDETERGENGFGSTGVSTQK